MAEPEQRFWTGSPDGQNVAGTWKETLPLINVGGTWKEGAVYQNVGGTWKN